ncbi:hypothetical protein K8I28_11980 [bacterium]|nr:hypothetical protein [bacterium]
MMKRLLSGLLMFSLLLLIAAGCNIFSFTAPDDSNSAKVEDAWEALWDGNYAEAEALFTEVINDDPTIARARWGRAKARMKMSGYSGIELISKLSTLDTNPAVGDPQPLPFMDLNTSDADALFQSMKGALEDIDAIYSGVATRPDLNAEDVQIDYTAVFAIQGILELRDTNQNGSIDSNDINVFALFQAGGDFEFGDEAAWDTMTEAEQYEVLSSVYNLLQTSSETVLSLLEDDSIPIDTSQLDGVLDGILGQDENGVPTGDGLSEYAPPGFPWPPEGGN